MFGLSLAELWLIGGALLIAAEIIVPGFFLVWVGAAAVLTGAIAGLLGLNPETALVIFALVTVALVISARTWLPYNAGGSAAPMLNQRAARLIGQIVRVEDAISASGGRVLVGDGAWSAKGCDAAAGTLVKITGTDGNTLIVEPEPE